MSDVRIIYKLDEIAVVLQDICQQICGQYDYEKVIDESIDGFWDNSSLKTSDIKIKVIYDNPNGLDYIIATYDKIQFQGRDVIIKNDKNSFSIINGNNIKRIDIKHIA